MKKLKETFSPLIHRTEITMEVEHFQKATPKKTEMTKSLASELKKYANIGKKEKAPEQPKTEEALKEEVKESG